jgi:hypothetical protein
MSYRTLTERSDIRNARRALGGRLKADMPFVARRSIGYPSGHIANAPARFELVDAPNSLAEFTLVAPIPVRKWFCRRQSLRGKRRP